MVNSMELEVGMYVRFDGIIRKIIDIDEDDYIEFDEEFGDPFGAITSSEKRETFIKFYNPEKASFNIIDLIKVGDYVNGEPVMRVFRPEFFDEEEAPYVITTISKYEEADIYTVLTKELVKDAVYRGR